MQTVSEFEKLSAGTGQATGRCKIGREQKPFLPGKLVTNGFLSHRFLPLFDCGTELPSKENTERDFFKSCSHITKAYGLTLIDTKGLAYPYNVQLSIFDLERQLKKIMDCKVLILTKAKNTFIALKQSYDTANSLYYIPVLPLYNLMKCKGHRRLSEMLLSVFCYLYHIASIPYYRDEQCYTYWQYEMLDDYLSGSWSEEDPQSYNSDRNELCGAIYIGDLMKRRMGNDCHLKDFAKRVNSFCPANATERRFHRICTKALSLYQKYPLATAFGNIEPDPMAEGSISADQYISFVYDTKGWASEMLTESLNNDFGEYGLTDEPELTLLFNKPYSDRPTGLDFERSLFPIIDNLRNLLYDLP